MRNLSKIFCSLENKMQNNCAQFLPGALSGTFSPALGFSINQNYNAKKGGNNEMKT